jgi:hypothetical protein
MEAFNRLAAVALAAALVSLGLSGYALLVVHRPLPAPAASCSCDLATLDRHLEDLERRPGRARSPGLNPQVAESIANLSDRVARVEQHEGIDAGAKASGPKQRETPRYSSLTTHSPAVSVSQDEHGALVARNTDPALTGSTLVVEAVREDGTVEQVVITAPAPE